MTTRYERHVFIICALMICTCFTFVSGCSHLPDYARPQMSSPEQGTQNSAGSFGYRPLTVGDFKAASLPASFTEHNHRIQARSCISLRPSSDTAIRIRQGLVAGQKVFSGTFSSFAVQAVFNPDCSWWNHEVPEKMVAYVLQHEQIHFALTQLTACRITHQSQAPFEQLLVFGASPEKVQAELAEKAQEVSREAMAQDIDQHTAFDEETSLYFEVEVQQRWFDKLNKQLATTCGK